MKPSNSKQFRVIFSFIERGIYGDVLLSTGFNIGISNNILLAQVKVGNVYSTRNTR